MPANEITARSAMQEFWRQIPGQDEYWLLVEECLVHFHSFTRKDAEATCADLADQLEGITHVEPFSLACDLAGANLEFAPHSDEYERLHREIEAKGKTVAAAFVELAQGEPVIAVHLENNPDKPAQNQNPPKKHVASKIGCK